MKGSAEKVLPQVYDELRKLAAAKLAGERAGHTLDATALVHEVYLKLGQSAEFADRSQFFRAAAEAMRRILVDHARKKGAEKRGGKGRRLSLADADAPLVQDPDRLLAVDEALAKLAAEDPASADVARLRLFAGLSVDEAAEALGVSRATAFRDWAYARAYLTTALSGREAI
jgi:RNA polymerase sigma factor (TIGR02999 family)